MGDSPRGLSGPKHCEASKLPSRKEGACDADSGACPTQKEKAC